MPCNHQRRQQPRGFTLLELLVVIAIIGLLSVVAIVRTRDMLNRARAARIVADFEAVREAALRHYADHGDWPTSDAPGEEPADLEPYLDGRLQWRQKSWRYHWLMWSQPSAPSAGAPSGDLVCFSVTTNDFRINRAVARIYKGPVWYMPGNNMTFPIENSLQFR